MTAPDHRRDPAVHPRFRSTSQDERDRTRALRQDVGTLSGSGQSGLAVGIGACRKGVEMTTSRHPINVAVLDDYQGVALSVVDWSKVSERANITVFRDHLTDQDAVAERLALFDVVCVMRERTPMPASLLKRLPRLKLIASTGSRNASIDLATAAERGITSRTQAIRPRRPSN
jgi:hypothetical protein